MKSPSASRPERSLTQPEETIEIFAVCEAMKRSAAQNGAKIRIQDVLAEVRK